MANYAFTRGVALPDVENGHEFRSSNFTQREPHTAIFTGKTGLRFIGCNLMNCDLPSDAEVIDCLHIHKSFCTNENPKLIDHGMTPCAENCSHVVDTDTITIDGQVVDTIYYYKNTRVE